MIDFWSWGREQWLSFLANAATLKTNHLQAIYQCEEARDLLTQAWQKFLMQNPSSAQLKRVLIVDGLQILAFTALLDAAPSNRELCDAIDTFLNWRGWVATATQDEYAEDPNSGRDDVFHEILQDLQKQVGDRSPTEEIDRLLSRAGRLLLEQDPTSWDLSHAACVENLREEAWKRLLQVGPTNRDLRHLIKHGTNQETLGQMLLDQDPGHDDLVCILHLEGLRQTAWQRLRELGLRKIDMHTILECVPSLAEEAARMLLERDDLTAPDLVNIATDAPEFAEEAEQVFSRTEVGEDDLDWIINECEAFRATATRKRAELRAHQA